MSGAGPEGSYPVFLRLAGRRVLLVGGGPVARDKGLELARAGARLRVVAPRIEPALARAADEVRARAFRPEDLRGAWLVVAAATPEVNRAVRAAADARSRFVVAVDDVEHCSAIGAARMYRGGVCVALSSDGSAPALVALLRRALEALLPEDLTAWHALAARARAEWKAMRVPLSRRRPLLLAALNALYPAEGAVDTRDAVVEASS